MLKRVTKELGIKNIAWLSLLTIILISCMFSFVNKFVEAITPSTTVILKVENSGDVWITGLNGNGLSYEIFNTAEKEGVWEYRDAIEYGYSCNAIVSYGENTGHYIAFDIKKSSNAGIQFWANCYCKDIVIISNGEERTLELYSEETGGEYLTIYPFEQSNFELIVKAVCYFILFWIVFVLLCFSVLMLVQQEGKEQVTSKLKYNPYLMTVLIFIFVIVCNVFYYKVIEIPNYLVFGDQTDYWLRATALLSCKTWDEFVAWAQATPIFRGYMCYIPSYLAQLVASLVKIDAVVVYFLFPAISAATLFGYILPRIYELFRNKKVTYSQVVLLVAIFSFFWFGTYTAILQDLMGATCFFAFVMYFLMFINTKKKRNMLLAGLMLGITTSFRLTYLYGAIVILVVFFSVPLIKIFVCIIKKQIICKEEYILLKRYSSGAFVFLSAIGLICVPQILINYLKGHYGLFAYDAAGAWSEPELTLAEFHANLALSSGVTFYPYGFSDSQVHSIAQIAGYHSEGTGTTLKMGQIFNAYAATPLDTLIAIFKRLFTLCDVKTNITYPQISFAQNSFFYLFSTANYFLYGTALYMLINKKLRTCCFAKKECGILGSIVIVEMAPLMITLAEWRYGLIIYIFVYYVVVFGVRELIDSRENIQILKNSDYLAFVVCFVFLAHLLSLTMLV